jgi:carbamoyl-phosphate synthase large subunit
MKDGTVDLVFNTTEGAQALKDSLSIRRNALMLKIPYYTTLAGSLAAVQAIEALRTTTLDVAPLQSFAR